MSRAKAPVEGAEQGAVVSNRRCQGTSGSTTAVSTFGSTTALGVGLLSVVEPSERQRRRVETTSAEVVAIAALVDAAR